jgi:ABC-type multidrug transport system ATPase subunit
MTAYAIETTALTHRFSKTDTVLHEIGLQVPIGSIYGFLGPNGAGKTTTLRLVLGLLRRQHGTIEVLGRDIGRNRLEILRQVGSSIESPSLYAQLTARENLRIWQQLFRCAPRRIGEVLDQVGLAGTGAKRAGAFSLGMKQRLAIAMALLHEPSLLVLDEPTNGLDPHGILEMRDLLVRLNRERGISIVVSSHLLSEVERLVTHVGIIHRGTMMFQGPLAALVAKRQGASITTIDTNDNRRALDLLSAGGREARLEQERVVIRAASPLDLGNINRDLVLAGLSVHEIATRGTDLENIFLDLIGD